MIESFVFSEGRPVSHNLEMEALRLARADKGLILWIDLTNPTPEETKSIYKIKPLSARESGVGDLAPAVDRPAGWCCCGGIRLPQRG